MAFRISAAMARRLERLSKMGMTRLQQQARDKFQASPVGQLARRAPGIISGREVKSQIRRLEQQFGLKDLNRIPNAGIRQYAVNRGRDAIMGELFKSLGPLGPLIKAAMRSKRRDTLESQAETAAKFLESLGYKVTTPGAKEPQRGAKEPQRPQVIRPRTQRPIVIPPRPGGPSLELVPPPPSQAAGDSWRPGAPTPPAPPQAPEPMGEAEPEYQPERKRAPIQMLRVSSSNVYAIGYDESSNDMYVTFLAGTGEHRSGQGATYVYRSVPADLFNQAVALRAGGMGEWVWDELRVRGSISGHQFQYELAVVGPSKYVPRQATHVGYRPRLVRQRGQVMGSTKLGTGFFEGTRAGQSERGRVSTGAPRAPRTGAP